MSENYTLWHGERVNQRTMSTYVTAINVQELGNADERFVRDMAGELGLAIPSAIRARLEKPFATNYLSSGPADDWRDTWLLTWKLILTAEEGLTLPESQVDVYAWDSSWDGQEASPQAFEVIVDGAGQDSDLSGFGDRVQGATCSLGHLHLRIPVEDEELGPTAAAAFELEQLCVARGWTTQWRDPAAPF